MAVWRKSAALTVLLLAAACAREGALREPPIEYLGAGVLMVPVDRDETGCVRYRLLAEGSQADHTVYWRVAKGNFTNNRANAACRPPPAPRPEKSRAF